MLCAPRGSPSVRQRNSRSALPAIAGPPGRVLRYPHSTFPRGVRLFGHLRYTLGMHGAPSLFDARYAAADSAPLGSLPLLPTPFATVIRSGGIVILVGPHSKLVPLSNVAWVLSLRPEIIKIIFGKARNFVEHSFTSRDLTLLEPFQSIEDEASAMGVLGEARDSVRELSDERLFVEWWESNSSEAVHPRTLERACLRYAGQSPRDIRSRQRLGLSLVSYGDGTNSYLDHYSDQSHFVREVRRATMMTPARIKNLSQPFYFHGRITATFRLSV